MKKIGLLALTLIIAASLMAACTAPTGDETTGSRHPLPFLLPVVIPTLPAPPAASTPWIPLLPPAESPAEWV